MNNTEDFKNTADQGREKQSTKAYLRFLESKGATTRMLYLRSRFLDSLTPNLVDQVQTRQAFANALKATMDTIGDEDKQDALHISREFFAFWMNDIKAIAKFESTYGFTTEATQWKPDVGSMKNISKQIDQMSLSAKERDAIINYNDKLNSPNNDKSYIEKRVKLAKVMLVCLRDAPNNNHMVYRTAVDIMLPLFQSREVKQRYLEVAREFYHIWKKSSDNH